MFDTLFNPVLPFSFASLTIFFLVNFEMYKIVPPLIIRPFRRNDPSINKPLIKAALNIRQMNFATTLIPLAILTICENFVFPNLAAKNLALKYYFGWVMLFLLFTTAKRLAGRLRPNFLAINKITFEASDTKLYSERDKCVDMKVSKSFVGRESRASFFSGHATMGLYAAVFLMIYLQEVIVSANYFSFVLQWMVFMIGLYPGISQATTFCELPSCTPGLTNKIPLTITGHHPSDVAIGFLIGSLGAHLAYYHVL